MQEPDIYEKTIQFVIDEIEREAHEAGFEVPYEEEIGESLYAIYVECKKVLGQELAIVD